MTREEMLKQLDDLKFHCGEMADKEEEDNVWNKDIEALQMAINLLKPNKPNSEIEVEINDLRASIDALNMAVEKQENIIEYLIASIGLPTETAIHYGDGWAHSSKWAAGKSGIRPNILI